MKEKHFSILREVFSQAVEKVFSTAYFCVWTSFYVSIQIKKRKRKDFLFGYDEDHPYGHGKAEVISSGIVAIILTLASLFISYESIKALFPPATEPYMIAFIAAVVSLVWKQILYVYTIRIGRKVNSKRSYRNCL